MGTKNQRAVYEWVNISDDLVYEWVNEGGTLRKHAYSNILKILLPKNENF